MQKLCIQLLFKGTVSQDFLLLVFFMNQFPPSSRVFHLDHLKFFRKFEEIFARQGAPPVSTTPVANFSTIFAGIVDTGGNLPPVSTTTAANLPPVSNNGNNFIKIFELEGFFHLRPVSLTPVANLELQIRRIFEKIRNGPNVIIRSLGETNSRKKPEAKNLVTLSL